jgi:LacI family transcriptional regulator
MGYSPNIIARGLVTKSTHNIGLIIPDITNPFFAELAQGVGDYAHQSHYNIFLCNSNWDIIREKESLNNLFNNRADGIIITPVSNDISHIIEMNDKIPVVFAANQPKCEELSYVVTDNHKAASLVMDYLIKLGHRRIAFVGGTKADYGTSSRLEGYLDSFKKYQIPVNPDFIMQGQLTTQSGYTLVKEMLLKSELPTSIVACNDMVALGVIQAIEEYGLNVPKDISVIGFDDISFSSLNKIQLTTVFQDKYKIGELSVKLLLDRIIHKNEDVSNNHILEPKLIIRKTCSGL